MSKKVQKHLHTGISSFTYPRQYSSPVKQKGSPGKKNDLTSEAIQLFFPI